MSEFLLQAGIRAPGPRGLPFLGCLLQFRRNPIQFLMDAHSLYGDIIRIKIRGLIVHLVTRPDYIEHVLVDRRGNYFKGYGYDDQKLLLGDGLITSEGSLWERQHRLMQPFFTPKGVGQFVEIMTECINEMLTRWGPLADTKNIIRVDDEMARLTGNIIVRILFDRNLDDETSSIDKAFQYCVKFIDQRSADLIASPMFLPTPSNRRFRRCLSIIHQFIDDRIDDQMKNPGKKNILSVLMNARDEDTGEGMNRWQLRDELVTLFVAGYQTTMHSLSWVWCMLDQHRWVADNLFREQYAVLEGKPPALVDIEKLPYAVRVIHEVLRLYPPVKVVAREVVEDDKIDGFLIPAKSIVLISPYITQRHPAFWENPEKFEPDRFVSDHSVDRSRYAFLPFSTGPRKCLGDNFAILEAVMVLTMVTQLYRLELVPGHPIEHSLEVKTPPLHGMPMTLHRQATTHQTRF